eukprot:2667853-Rhodomonas_salina.1
MRCLHFRRQPPPHTHLDVALGGVLVLGSLLLWRARAVLEKVEGARGEVEGARGKVEGARGKVAALEEAQGLREGKR